MLQKRKENPQIEDSKGNFNYSEKSLDPVDFMAFTVFNPRAFEHIWRKWQPKGNLVFAELPPEGQNALLEELIKQVKFELGDHYINGEFGDDDDHLMNGILTQAAKDTELIIVSTSKTTMLDKLKAVRKAIPKALRSNPNLRLVMSVDDFDKYDDELTERESKNASETDVNSKRYKGITIETLAAWPDDLIVATLCSPDADGNWFAAVNLQDDQDVIQIDKIANASELYFFKLLMKADTNIAFGEEMVVLDTRTSPVFKSSMAGCAAPCPMKSWRMVGFASKPPVHMMTPLFAFTFLPPMTAPRISFVAGSCTSSLSGASVRYSITSAWLVMMLSSSLVICFAPLISTSFLPAIVSFPNE